jgi:hypothetical protein
MDAVRDRGEKMYVVVVFVVNFVFMRKFAERRKVTLRISEFRLSEFTLFAKRDFGGDGMID